MTEQEHIDQVVCRRILAAQQSRQFTYNPKIQVGDQVTDIGITGPDGDPRIVSATVEQRHVDAVDLFCHNFHGGTGHTPESVNFRIEPRAV